MPTPTLTSPAANATGVSLTPTLELSVTFPILNPFCEHDETQWQVASSPGFGGDVVWDSGFSAAGKTSRNVPNGQLSTGTDYWWRARVKDDESLPFSDEISAWSSARKFTTVALPSCTTPPTPSLNAPADGATGVPLTPTLEAGVSPFALIFSGCEWDRTQWQIASDPAFGPGSIVFDSGFTGADKTSIDVPSGNLVFNGTYYWRARIRDVVIFGTGPTSSWSAVRMFKTVTLTILCTWGTITHDAPADGATGLTTTPTLEVDQSFGGPFPGPCSHDVTQWQIATDPGFGAGTIVYDSGDDGANLTSLTVPGGELSFNTTYHWRARFKNADASKVSNWTAPTEFSTQPLVLGCFWGTIAHTAPGDGATGQPLTPTLEIDYTPPALPALPCSHDVTQWQVATDAGFGAGTIAYDSGDDGSNLTSLSVPGGNLSPDTVYYWRVRVKNAGASEVSNWSTATRFRTQAPAPGNAPPNADFDYNPGSPQTGQPVQFSDASTDPDGAGDLVSWSWDFGDGTTSTSQNPTHTYSDAVTFTVRLQVTDSAGQTGTVVKNVTVSSAPSGGSDSVAAAVAALVPNDPAGPNADQVIGDREINQAITLWISGAPVPGTGGDTIDDGTILQLIGMWIGGAQVSSSSASPALLAQARRALPRLVSLAGAPEPLRVRSVRIVPQGADRWRLSLVGSGVRQLDVSVFDAAGRLVLSETGLGASLALAARADDGRRLANGVYLVAVTAHGFDGRSVRTEFQKWAVLR